MAFALSHAETRRILWRVLGQSNLLAPSYVPENSLGTVYNEGLRAVGLWLMGYVEATAPDAGLRLLLAKDIKKDIGGE
jgi:hypothetical protein